MNIQPSAAALYAALQSAGLSPVSVALLQKNGIADAHTPAPYSSVMPYDLYSLSKMFTATAIGFLVSEGVCSLESSVATLLPLSEKGAGKLSGITVRHCITMTSGLLEDSATAFRAAGTPGILEAVLAATTPTPPGVFFYNSFNTYLLSCIVSHQTGQNLSDYLLERLFLPLGIQKPIWAKSTDGVEYGCYGLRLTAREVAQFGLLYLNDGVFQGRQVLPSGWAAAATAKVVDTTGTAPDWARGYGLGFWQCQKPGVVRGDGLMGQFCILLPDQGLVLVVFSACNRMRESIEKIWDWVEGGFPACVPTQTGSFAGDLLPLRGEYLCKESENGITALRVLPEAVELSAKGGTWRLGRRAWKIFCVETPGGDLPYAGGCFFQRGAPLLRLARLSGPETSDMTLEQQAGGTLCLRIQINNQFSPWFRHLVEETVTLLPRQEAL